MLKYTVDGNNRLVLTTKAWAELRRVNRLGNEVVWTSDEETWGVIERWDFPRDVASDKIEDCDGITLYKLDMLLKAGFPASALLFTVCKTEENEGHAVLCVTTDRGDFICDNRHEDVQAFDKLRDDGYQFLYRTVIGGKLDGLWDRIGENR
jgi:predicted transglutaminase-like cysteine proteinase